eukprot:GHVN01097720.1.p1 GENE.GHVN01097720.1~~GHVN01097720.1.p1  ORF type:complete len:131 (+),score=5.64 GHVN01097720.1:95-487(+)
MALGGNDMTRFRHRRVRINWDSELEKENISTWEEKIEPRLRTLLQLPVDDRQNYILDNFEDPKSFLDFWNASVIIKYNEAQPNGDVSSLPLVPSCGCPAHPLEEALVSSRTSQVRKGVHDIFGSIKTVEP